ncbi:tyrosine-type recombinase/integrase [Pseudomonas citronellolis]|uniref:tyrosine-type recombinase/integrase n=1 Tax=Pseudomonas citronellolis TaxID=53408 RepID=UPI003C2C1B75
MATITDKQMTSKPAKPTWLIEDAPRGCGRFMARLRPNGERHFYFRYTNSSGERVFLPLGVYDSSGVDGLTLKEARHKAGELSRLYQSGIRDLREHLQSEEEARIAAQQAEQKRLAEEKAAHEAALAQKAARKTVQDLFEHWAKVDLINRKDGGKEIRRMFGKDVLPILGQIPLEDIKKGHITEVTDALLARGVNRMAKMIFSLMRQMFRFAVDRDWLDHDPTASIRKAKIGGKDVERDRVLSEDEIYTLTQLLPNAGLLASIEAAVWIALSTCCRIGELINARWENIDLDGRSWLIPAEDSKNGKSHTIILSDFSIRHFKKIHTLSGHTPWCYPNSKKTGPVCSKTITKQLGDRQRDEQRRPMSNRSAMSQALRLKGGKWTPHDLRRTGATLMTALGVLPEVAERCLNHTEENKIKRTYQRHSYTKEMSAAWQALGEYLQTITQP